MHPSKTLARARWLALGAICVLAACSAQEDTAKTNDALIEKSAAIADRFQVELKGELSSALSTVGPIGAIGVCQSAAPAIAQRLSEENGIGVMRIARRNRNPGNVLTDGLDRLYSDLEAGPVDDGKPRAVHATIDDRFVYMRAIPMQEKPCSTCHGTQIEPALEQAIAEAYPEDRATGFKPGELRGAFLIEHTAAP